jgi:hypothetical protein
MKNRYCYLLLICFPFLISECFVTTHSFNHGKLLNPGERLITTGFGWKYSARYIKESHYDFDSLGRYKQIDYYDSTRFGWFNFAVDYRVGVLRKYPFGKGLETGFHVESAMRGNQYIGPTKKGTTPEMYYSPLLELDTRFGLPDITLNNGIFHHNVSWGWIVGQWVDNGWFWGYAMGLEFQKLILFSSFRYAMTPTDKFYDAVAVDSDQFFKKHDRTHGVRILCGTSIKLPFNESALPEYITPEFSLMFPNFNHVQPVGFSFSIGIRWMPKF